LQNEKTSAMLSLESLGIVISGVARLASRRDLIKGSSEYLILCLIAQQPMYGYQIVKELEARSQGYFKFKEGTLYPALHRLEKAGLIAGRWQTLPNGRQRRYYHITDKGTTVMAEGQSQWLNFLSAMNLIIKPAGAHLRWGNVSSIKPLP